MSIPVVDEVVAAFKDGHEVTGYPGLYPTHEFGLDVKGILKVFPIEGCMQYDKDGEPIKSGGGGGSEISLASLFTGGAMAEAYEIPFMYNPTKYTESKKVLYDTASGKNPDPLRVYKGGGARKIKMELFCDASWGGVAGTLMGRLFGLIPPEGQGTLSMVSEALSMVGIARPTVGHYCNLWKALVLDREAQRDSVVFSHMEGALDSIGQSSMSVPPFCILAMGPYIEMQCTCTSVNITYEMFDDFLNPIRANIQVEFEQVFMSDYGKEASTNIEWEKLVPYSGYGLRQKQKRDSMK